MNDRNDFNKYLNGEIRYDLFNNNNINSNRNINTFDKDINELIVAFDAFFADGKVENEKREIWDLLVGMLMDTINKGINNGSYNKNSVANVPINIILKILKENGVNLSSEGDIFDKLTKLSAYKEKGQNK